MRLHLCYKLIFWPQNRVNVRCYFFTKTLCQVFSWSFRHFIHKVVGTKTHLSLTIFYGRFQHFSTQVQPRSRFFSLKRKILLSNITRDGLKLIKKCFEASDHVICGENKFKIENSTQVQPLEGGISALSPCFQRVFSFFSSH